MSDIYKLAAVEQLSKKYKIMQQTDQKLVLWKEMLSLTSHIINDY